jgi:histidyl-tRNA synthetase
LRALANLEGGIETLGPARDILSSLSGVSLEALDDLQTTLEAVAHLAPAPPSLAVDLTVARGLDYYTGMVFEVKVPEMGGEGQVLGGGSYKLLHLFGLPDLDPCCGFGLGFDRVLLGLEAQAEAAGREEVVPGEVDPLGTIAVIPFGIDASHVLPIVAALRNAGERVDLELRSRKIGKAMKWANSTGAAFTVVVGPRDLESGQAMLKSLKSGEQQAVELNAEALQAALAAMRS